MNNEVLLGMYRHYKGHTYEVIAIGRIEATLEPVVIYRALYESPDFGKDAVWVRPVSSFLETVECEDGKKVPRFEYVSKEVQYE